MLSATKHLGQRMGSLANGQDDKLVGSILRADESVMCALNRHLKMPRSLADYADFAVKVRVMTTLFCAIAMFARLGGSMPKSVM